MTTPQQAPDPGDLFSGKGQGIGAPSASFNAVGDTISGIVKEVRSVQKTKYMGANYQGEPVLEFWDEAKTRPIWQAAVILTDTGVYDPNRDGDDGTRVLYCDGDAKKPDTKMGSVGAVCAAKGDASPQPGGWLRTTFTGWTAGVTYDQRKTFESEYLTPVEVQMQGVPAHASRQSKLAGGGNGQGNVAVPAGPAATNAPNGAAPPGVDPQMWAQFLASQGGGNGNGAQAQPQGQQQPVQQPVAHSAQVAQAVLGQQPQQQQGGGTSMADIAAQLAAQQQQQQPKPAGISPEIIAAAQQAGVDPAALAAAMAPKA